MSKVNLGWLQDAAGERIAPKTFMSQVLSEDGQSLDKFLEDFTPSEGGGGGVGQRGEGEDSVIFNSGSNQATAQNTAAFGDRTAASAKDAFATGRDTVASGVCSHTEGMESQATNSSTHAEGYQTHASGDCAHAEGYKTKAMGDGSHAEGVSFYTDSQGSRIEEDYYVYINDIGEVSIQGPAAYGHGAHAEGAITCAGGDASHSEGLQTFAKGLSSHAEGYSTQALENTSHAEGYCTCAAGYASHAEGYLTVTRTTGSHAEGYSTCAWSDGAHAEGCNAYAYGRGSHAEGNSTRTEKEGAHAEGGYTQALGLYSHAEGYYTNAAESYDHAEGYYTRARGTYSHAEGSNTTATGESSHAEGYFAQAKGNYTHAEGYRTTAQGACSHAEGKETYAYGYGHAEGYGTITPNDYCHVQGVYNNYLKTNPYKVSWLHMVGNGGFCDSGRSNAHTLDWNGNAEFAGDVVLFGCKSISSDSRISIGSLLEEEDIKEDYFYWMDDVEWEEEGDYNTKVFFNSEEEAQKIYKGFHDGFMNISFTITEVSFSTTAKPGDVLYFEYRTSEHSQYYYYANEQNMDISAAFLYMSSSYSSKKDILSLNVDWYTSGVDVESSLKGFFTLEYSEKPAAKKLPIFKSDAISSEVPRIKSASPGQLVSIKTVDENGKPSEWETISIEDIANQVKAIL